jgi:cytochrome c oxidase subunit 2
MKEFLMVVLGALIFVVIFQIAKASEYVSVLKGEEKTRKQNNKINAFFLLGFLVFGLIGVWYCNELYYGKTLFPQGSASVEGESLDKMFMITTAITGVVFVITQYFYSGSPINTRKKMIVKRFIFLIIISWSYYGQLCRLFS